MRFGKSNLPYLEGSVPTSPQDIIASHFAWMVWDESGTDITSDPPKWKPFTAEEANTLENSYRKYVIGQGEPTEKLAEFRTVDFRAMMLHDTSKGGQYKVLRVWYRWWWIVGLTYNRFDPVIEDLLELKYAARDCTELICLGNKMFLINLEEMAEFRLPGSYSRYELRREGTPLTQGSLEHGFIGGKEVPFNIVPFYWDAARPWDNTEIVYGSPEWTVISTAINKSISPAGRKKENKQ